MVLFTKLLTNKSSAFGFAPILSMVLFTKLLTLCSFNNLLIGF